jgi:hypothetical protein
MTRHLPTFVNYLILIATMSAAAIVAKPTHAELLPIVS